MTTQGSCGTCGRHQLLHHHVDEGIARRSCGACFRFREKRTYYCAGCGMMHRKSSRTGREHWPEAVRAHARRLATDTTNSTVNVPPWMQERAWSRKVKR